VSAAERLGFGGEGDCFVQPDLPSPEKSRAWSSLMLDPNPSFFFLALTERGGNAATEETVLRQS
jgi:hypothetical protein